MPFFQSLVCACGTELRGFAQGFVASALFFHAVEFIVIPVLIIWQLKQLRTPALSFLALLIWLVVLNVFWIDMINEIADIMTLLRQLIQASDAFWKKPPQFVTEHYVQTPYRWWDRS